MLPPDAVSVNRSPLQIVNEGAALIEGVGTGSTVTETVAVGLVHPSVVTNKEYVPDAAVPAVVMTGSSAPDVNVLGPLHE